MAEQSKEDMKIIRDLIDVLGIGDIPNIVGFSLNVKRDNNVTINIEILAGRDGMANFIRTFPKKYKLTELEPEKSGLNKFLNDKQKQS